ncbi:MAG: small multi-drug export protein [Methanocalculaceae archaeon]|jgi:uncharacterized membrane protein|nr:small multi-drug export protein [Methanocalculaceae archaeon]
MTEEERPTQKWMKTVFHRTLFLGGPIAVYCVYLFVLWLVYPPESSIFGPPSRRYMEIIGLLAAYVLPPLGKETIIPTAIAVLGISPWIICSGIILTDIASCMIIILNFDLLEKIPFVGGLVHKLMDSANKNRKKSPWVERLSHPGLLIFMYIPMQGSGAVTTTILGQLFGMRMRTVFGIVTAGSMLSTLSIAVIAIIGVRLWEKNCWYAVVAVVGVVAAALVCWKLWQHYTKRRFGSGK